MTILEALAELLTARGHGTWQPDGTYTADQTGIVLGALPDSPDRVIGLALYGGSEGSAWLPYDAPNVQFRVRGSTDARIAMRAAQALYDDLHGITHVQAGGVQVNEVIGLQSGPIYVGQDRNNRHEWTVNFRADYLNTNRS